jgi:TM2 domain-containing membrane protein YozV
MVMVINKSICYFAYLIIFSFISRSNALKFKNGIFLQSLQTDDKSKDTTDNNFFIVKRDCNVNNCSDPNARCMSSDTCQCKKGYAHTSRNEAKSCSYVQKSQSTLFILELFFPFGVGHFYAGQLLHGILKLLLFLFAFLFDCFIRKIMTSNKIRETNLYQFISAIFYIILILWQITDLCFIGMNKYLDFNNVPLDAWGDQQNVF